MQNSTVQNDSFRLFLLFYFITFFSNQTILYDIQLKQGQDKRRPTTSMSFDFDKFEKRCWYKLPYYHQ